MWMARGRGPAIRKSESSEMTQTIQFTRQSDVELEAVLFEARRLRAEMFKTAFQNLRARLAAQFSGKAPAAA